MGIGIGWVCFESPNLNNFTAGLANFGGILDRFPLGVFTGVFYHFWVYPRVTG